MLQVPLNAFISLLVSLGRGPTPAPPIRLDADLGDRVLKIVQNGSVVKTYGIAVGRPSHPTPTGSFTTTHLPDRIAPV